MATTTRKRRTAPTPIRPLFPAVPLGIFDLDGDLQKVIYLDDPRNAYIRAMNSLDVGVKAGPLSDEGEYSVWLVDRSGADPDEKVHTCERLDEAMQFVRQWGRDDKGFTAVIREGGAV